MVDLELGDKSIALVVDDSPESLGMVSAALEAEGMTVLVARDGRSAIQLTNRVQPDVILMDAVMPELDGFETCRRLKFGDNPTPAPIIFMTGLTDQEHVLKGLRSGGVDYITKPVVVEEMIARLTTHVLNARALSSAREALGVIERAVIAFDADGALVWGTPTAHLELETHRLDIGGPDVVAWLRGCIRRPVSAVDTFPLSETHALQFIGISAVQDVLIKLVQRRSGRNEDVLQSAFGLTAREAEVLYWLTLGKTNRDISAILSLSSRTVNKHLEQVFQKMGVDNRTSAAVLADRKLNAFGA
ncbi:MAG: DNA-binding response regulator [Pseudomonadota bacterium]